MTAAEIVVKDRFSKFLAYGTRATTIEYILIAVGIVFAIMAVMKGLGVGLNIMFAPCPC